MRRPTLAILTCLALLCCGTIALASESKTPSLPEVTAAAPDALEKLTAAGAQVTPLFGGSPLLEVSFALRNEPVTDAQLALLADVAEQVYSLNLSKSQATHEGLAVLAKLKHLTKLHLEHSSINDQGLAHLTGLTELQYLNLYDTKITDTGLKALAGVKQLKHLFVWKTAISFDAAQTIEKQIDGLTVDLGFNHPVVVRNRVTKQLEQAKQRNTEADTNIKNAQTLLDRAKHNQTAAQKRLDELQKKMDQLDGKTTPESKDESTDEKPEATEADNKV